MLTIRKERTNHMLFICDNDGLPLSCSEVTSGNPILISIKETAIFQTERNF